MKVLLLSDILAHGRVASNVISPILIDNGMDVYSIPTVLLSNIFSYEENCILDTSEYMKNCMDMYIRNDIQFDYIIIGYILNKNQIEIIKNFLRFQHKAKIVLDPIMGDNGKLYHGVDKEKVEDIRELGKYADYILPNETEASILSKNGLSELKKQYKSIIITSSNEEDKYFIKGYDSILNEEFKIEYKNVEGSFPGTGDIFLAYLVKYLSQGYNVKTSSKKASDKIYNIILKEKEDIKKYDGIRIEKYLGGNDE